MSRMNAASRLDPVGIMGRVPSVGNAGTSEIGREGARCPILTGPRSAPGDGPARERGVDEWGRGGERGMAATSFETARDLLAFIGASPTPRHCVVEVARRLMGAGFASLDEATR